MSREFRTVWIVALVAIGLIAAALLLRTSEELRPQLVGAFVAIQADGEEIARSGSVRIEPGTGFRLFAAVEAVDWRGRTFYLTEAPALELDGRRIDEGQIRSWSEPGKARVLWFTVEGAPPFIEVDVDEDLERLRYREVFQADWPQAWTVPGRIDPAVENILPDAEERGMTARFGVQRFHVRVEVFGPESDLLPVARLRSPGVEALLESREGLPTVIAELEWPLRALSRVFGVPQIEVSGEASEALATEVRVRVERGLAFGRVRALRSWLAEAGGTWEDLAWQPVELNGSSPWRHGAAIRAGSKVAFLFDDLGVSGRLDQDDLCLDFDKGATVRTLGEIFVGEGLVELAAPPGTRPDGSVADNSGSEEV